MKQKTHYLFVVDPLQRDLLDYCNSQKACCEFCLFLDGDVCELDTASLAMIMLHRRLYSQSSPKTNVMSDIIQTSINF